MINVLINRLPENLIKSLKDLPQGPKWHSEGNLYNHILLVSDKLPKDNVDLQVCALFHDLGKLDTTKIQEVPIGIKISAIGHENYVSKYIQLYKHLFEDLHVDWGKVEVVCKQHMRMHTFINGEMKNVHKRASIASSIYFRDLYDFAKADMEGRYTGSRQILVLTVGIPGSGKSTWAKAFCEKTGYVRVCPDDIRKRITGNISDISKDGVVWSEAFDTIENLLETGKNVVFDSTMVNSKTRKRMISLFENYAVIVYKLFPCTSELAKDRIKTDINSNVERSNVPENVVDSMYQNWCDNIEYFKNSLRVVK